MAAPLVKVLHRMQELFSNLVAALEAMILFPSLFRNPSRKRRKIFQGAHWRRRTLDDFAEEVDRLFTAPLTLRNMIIMSEKIREQFRSCLQSSPVCMLPSYNHALPSGTEKGTYLALDVGGSTFRVALIELGGEGAMKILRESFSRIDNDVKLLEGTLFFDWMAEKIESMLLEVSADYGRGAVPLSMGLSWSFPIEQTSISSGLVIHMGKGFLCSNGTLGQELGDLIVQSCQRRSLNVQVDAIVNDSSATLLSRAYIEPKTRMSLILGTGTNVALHFPVHEIGLSKFGTRPPGWFDYAKHVIINTEMSMFGGGILPMTRWDDVLNRTHLRPDYQPLEYMITGRYLGEIVRLIMTEAVETAQLFGGELPHSMRDPYTFDTSIVAFLEADTSPSLAPSAALLQKEHTFPVSPTVEDLRFLRQICQIVSKRAAGYLATAIHSMWCLRNGVEFPEGVKSKASSTKDTQEITVVESDDDYQSLSIACDGSVINKYPGFRDRCQDYLDQLTKQTNTSQGTSDVDASSFIRLELAPESAIMGAAVAVAVAVAEKSQ
ncbi:putative hexokinase [Aspergillus clavatus NRRL 1]|uniref:Phosphotransferase n=1 Tax=Aspergillus clavatus (strain ATCC 1007 / CBS 513.65 / DSM 816 / NCTC 3887 / NRRL 1 / QM 1276 / 107) TaxID=344612 RepID=A1CD90_ASPCL|nr:hexokinase, putative [Aspergillus clavatus NRRL 1]EAW11817.1 hexokinase, putative [Aspergillus clavatus NRRL 1]